MDRVLAVESSLFVVLFGQPLTRKTDKPNGPSDGAKLVEQ